MERCLGGAGECYPPLNEIDTQMSVLACIADLHQSVKELLVAIGRDELFLETEHFRSHIQTQVLNLDRRKGLPLHGLGQQIVEKGSAIFTRSDITCRRQAARKDDPQDQ